MTEERALQRAMEIATEAHAGQVDKYGYPYLGHVCRVAYAGRTFHEQLTGLLHDVVEDNPAWTLDRLNQEGFPKPVMQAVAALTKAKEEAYEHYLERVKQVPLATRVKLNDLKDNMDLSRYPTVRPEDLPRLNKYLQAYHLLTELLNRTDRSAT